MTQTPAQCTPDDIPEIPFTVSTAKVLRDAFNTAADELDSQVIGRNVAADEVLQDFLGPHADTYRANRQAGMGDLARLSGAMRQVGYLAEQAIAAHAEKKADLEKNFFEGGLDLLKELFGLDNGQPIPAPPSCRQLTISSLYPKTLRKGKGPPALFLVFLATLGRVPAS